MHGFVEFKNLESDKVFFPTMYYDWPGVDYSVKIRTPPPNKQDLSTRVYRMRETPVYELDLQYSTSFALVGFVDMGDHYETVTVFGQYENKSNKVVQRTSYAIHKKSDKSLADAILASLGPCSSTIDNVTDFRSQCDRLEHGTDKILSNKDSCEPCELIHIHQSDNRKEYNSNDETYTVGETMVVEEPKKVQKASKKSNNESEEESEDMLLEEEEV
ncbi:MAG: hypothetical protein ACRC5M_04930 [Anaeroplasmataceae bacterium]